MEFFAIDAFTIPEMFLPIYLWFQALLLLVLYYHYNCDASFAYKANLTTTRDFCGNVQLCILFKTHVVFNLTSFTLNCVL